MQKTKAPRKYKGWVYIPETEVQESSVNPDKEDTSLTLEKIQDLREGPKGEGAVGKIDAKVFDGVEYRGTVDSFRQRFYYHITYTDGDEEDMSQIELRDAYLLANTEEIEAEWVQLKGLEKEKDVCEMQVNTVQASEGETSGSEGSEYDRHDYDEEMKQTKRKRKTTYKPAKQRPKTYKRANAKRVNELSGVILPHDGDKTVAGEAFSKLDDAQKKLVTEKVNKKTKQVKPFVLSPFMFNNNFTLFFYIRSQNNLLGIKSLT